MLPVFYASHDGHTKTIASAIAQRLSEKNIAATPVNVADPAFAETDLTALPLFVLVAAIRYGFHLPAATQALTAYAALEQRPPLALASVNLSARKPNKNAPDTNPYLVKWIRRHKVKPVLAAAFAGKLNYPVYKNWEKLAIKLIMTMSGGETDTTAVIDFTDWQRVERWADNIATFLKGETPQPKA